MAKPQTTSSSKVNYLYSFPSWLSTNKDQGQAKQQVSQSQDLRSKQSTQSNTAPQTKSQVATTPQAPQSYYQLQKQKQFEQEQKQREQEAFLLHQQQQQQLLQQQQQQLEMEQQYLQQQQQLLRQQQQQQQQYQYYETSFQEEPAWPVEKTESQPSVSPTSPMPSFYPGRTELDVAFPAFLDNVPFPYRLYAYNWMGETRQAVASRG
jgi:hypothetical protein